jgi:hypothetical protein
MKKKFDLERKIEPKELGELIVEFSNNRFWIPQIEDVRTKMV